MSVYQHLSLSPVWVMIERWVLCWQKLCCWIMHIYRCLVYSNPWAILDQVAIVMCIDSCILYRNYEVWWMSEKERKPRVVIQNCVRILCLSHVYWNHKSKAYWQDNIVGQYLHQFKLFCLVSYRSRFREIIVSIAKAYVVTTYISNMFNLPIPCALRMMGQLGKLMKVLLGL